MSQFHYQGIWRMDWGFENPNKTAAFIALLVLAIWILPLVRRWLFWVALPAFAALGVCLMHTMSRGGLIAAFAGLGTILWQLPCPWPRDMSSWHIYPEKRKRGSSSCLLAEDAGLRSSDF